MNENINKISGILAVNGGRSRVYIYSIYLYILTTTFVSKIEHFIKNRGVIKLELKLKEIFCKRNLSGYELAIYCVLLSLLKPDDYILYVHTEMIEMEVMNSTTIPKRLISMIKESLESLIEKLSLTVIEVSKNKKKYILDCRSLYIANNEPYISLTTQELRKILDIENVNNFILLKYFVSLIEIINDSKESKHKVEKEKRNVQCKSISIQTIAEVTHLNPKTIFEYNRALEIAELLYIDQKNYVSVSKGSGERFYRMNVYKRNNENDATVINEYGYQNCTCIDSKRNFSNYKRKMSQRYNQINKGKGEKYSDLEINEVYQYILSENQKYIRMYEKDKNAEHLSKIRSVEVFEDLDNE